MTPAGRLLFALAAGALAVSAGCGPAETHPREAEIAANVEAFHARLNQERYAEVYESASEELRARVGREEFVKTLAEARRRAGRTTGKPGVIIIGDDLRGRLRGLFSGRETISNVALTECEAGRVDEKFSWAIRGGQIKLADYELRLVLEPGKIYGIGPAR